jgi:hypothetical protein
MPQNEAGNVLLNQTEKTSVKQETVTFKAYYHALDKYFPLTKPVIKGDSIIAFDNQSNTFSKIYLPVIEKQYRNQVYALAKTLVNTELKEFRNFVIENVEGIYLNAGDTSLFEAWPVKVFCTSNFVGIAYLTRELPYAGVHSNYFYKTINVKNGKTITADDFFAIKTIADTLTFIKILDKHLESIDCKKGMFNSELNFLIREDSINFFFSSYEAGAFSQGTPEITVSKVEFKGLLVQ